MDPNSAQLAPVVTWDYFYFVTNNGQGVPLQEFLGKEQNFWLCHPIDSEWQKAQKWWGGESALC